MEIRFKNPPLIEALLEVKWGLKKTGPDTFIDKGFQWATGRLFDRIKDKFPYTVDLPITDIPVEISPFQVRHQFRAEKNGWPLVQLGPGISSVNYTSTYTWDKFTDTVKFLIPKLKESYQGIGENQDDVQLKLKNATLRYINGIKLNWEEMNALDFIESKLHTKIKIPESVSQDENIHGQPVNVNFQMGLQIQKPVGQSLIRFATGKVGQEKGLIWELIFISHGIDAPQLIDEDLFMIWLTTAHDVIEKMFLEFCDGELKLQFEGE